jgi:hypothetical protein
MSILINIDNEMDATLGKQICNTPEFSPIVELFASIAISLKFPGM